MPQEPTKTIPAQNRFPWRDYVAPKFWPTWASIGILWLLSRGSLNQQLRIGRGFGSLLWTLIPGRRAVTQTNLSLAFPEKSSNDVDQLGKLTYQHIGMGIFEAAFLWFRRIEKLDDRFELHGTEYLQDAIDKGKGVILLQAHFSSLEVLGGILGRRWPISAVYDKPKNALYAHHIEYQRLRHLHGLIDNKDIRSMIRRLKRGEIVWYSPDQSVQPRNGGIATRYFDQDVLTTAGTARIVAMTGATVVPLLPVRHKNGNSYSVKFLPAMELDVSDPIAATQQVNDLFEQQVRQHPEQYFWVHKRFKPPPDAGPSPYS